MRVASTPTAHPRRHLASSSTSARCTIRRDLDLLVDEPYAARVRGGAVAVGPQEFEARFREHARRRGRAIAREARRSRRRRGAIGIDASSTMQRLAARLGEARDVTVLRTGPTRSARLQDHSGVTALLTGGELRPPDRQPRRAARHPPGSRSPSAPLVRERRRGRPRRRGERGHPRGGRGEDPALAGSASEVVLRWSMRPSSATEHPRRRSVSLGSGRRPCHRTSRPWTRGSTRTATTSTWCEGRDDPLMSSMRS